MKAKKTVAKKKVAVKKKKVIKEDNFECAGCVGPVEDFVTEAYVGDVKKGGFESFSYQRRAEDFVEENVIPVPGDNKIFLISILVLLAVVAYVLYR